MYLLTELHFHFCKTDYIQSLKDMCAVGWIPKDDYVVLLCVFEEVETVVRTVAIHEENTGTSSCFIFSLCIKALNQPLIPQLTVSPPIWRVHQSANSIKLQSSCGKVCTHKAFATLLSAHFVMKF